MRSGFCFSVLQSPRFRMRLITGNPLLEPISYASIWYDGFRGIATTRARNSAKPVGSNTNWDSREEVEPGLLSDEAKSLSGRLKWAQETDRLSGRLKQQEVTTKKVYIRKNNIVDGAADVTASTNYCDVLEKYRDIQRGATFIVFDIETTGFSREKDGIVEFAMRDTIGGDSSTFETLVNPGCDVPNTHIHGISRDMVNRPHVPKFKDLIPILLQYVESRRIPETPVVLVSHNARTFDVPFLINEFRRCSQDIPSDWRFLDTLPLARELAKLQGTEKLSGKSLQALREYYGIPLLGEAHRAMSDVHSLSRILRELTIDLKLPVSALLEKSFTASEIVKKKKKTTG